MKQPNPPAQTKHKYTLFLRLWHSDHSIANDWRVSVEILESGRRIGFANLEQLFAFLLNLIEPDGEMQSLNDNGKETVNE